MSSLEQQSYSCTVCSFDDYCSSCRQDMAEHQISDSRNTADLFYCPFCGQQYEGDDVATAHVSFCPDRF